MSSPQPQYPQTPSGQAGAWYNYPPYLEAIGDGQSLAVPFHTVITAPFIGKVTRSNYGETGGQVDVQMPDGSSYSFVHLDLIDPAITPGASVTPGQYVGLSGGEHADYPGALHPATPQYSTAPHIDFDIWTAGAWSSTPQPNIALQAINALQQRGIVGGGPGQSPLATPTTYGSTVAGSAGSVGGNVCGPVPTSANPFDYMGWAFCNLTNTINTTIGNPLANVGQVFSTGLPILNVIGGWVTQPLRIVKLVLGGGLVFLALGIAFFPDIAAGAVAAAGFPELSPSVHGALKGGSKRATGGAISSIAGSTVGGGEARQAARGQRAVARARVTEGNREQARAQRAETTRQLNQNVQAYNVPTRPLSPRLPNRAPLAPTPPRTGDARRDAEMQAARESGQVLGPLHTNVRRVPGAPTISKRAEKSNKRGALEAIRTKAEQTKHSTEVYMPPTPSKGMAGLIPESATPPEPVHVDDAETALKAYQAAEARRVTSNEQDRRNRRNFLARSRYNIARLFRKGLL